MTEIPNYPNYTIDHDGNIFSKKSNKFLKPCTKKTGYKEVMLYPYRKSITVHRLVMLTFAPIDDKTLEIDQIDRNKTNNKLNNLRWVTKKENNQNKGDITCSTTNLKNITFDKKKGLFKVYKYFESLEDAKQYLSSF